MREISHAIRIMPIIPIDCHLWHSLNFLLKRAGPDEVRTVIVRPATFCRCRWRPLPTSTNERMKMKKNERTREPRERTVPYSTGGTSVHQTIRTNQRRDEETNFQINSKPLNQSLLLTRNP